MAATPEAKVKAQIKTILAKHGVYYAMPIGSGFGNSGVPDFLCCVKGRFLAIEAKANGGKPTALQLANLEKITTCQGISRVIDEHSLLELKNLLADLTSKD